MCHFSKKANSAFNLEVANRPNSTVVFIMSGQTGCDLFFFSVMFGLVQTESRRAEGCSCLL